MSPSYRWHGPEFPGRARTWPKPRLSLFYHDTGAPRDNGIGEMTSIAMSQGFIPGRDLVSIVYTGAGHYEACWAARFPSVLVTLLGTGEPPAHH